MEKGFYSAFTLAEVLIVVTIIGVVAMFTLPVLLSDVSERINSNRQANIAQKITKATEVMIVNGDYENFATTDDFVDKLQKYLKISKRCDSEHLADCWPSNTVTTAEGSKYNVSDAKTGSELHTGNLTNNVGLVLADGASIILTFNPNAPLISAERGFKAQTEYLPIGGGNKKEFAYTSNATDAIDFVMDVNGSTGPNAETDINDNYFDIRSFKIASFSGVGCQGEKMGGVCYKNLGTNYPILDCNDSKNSAFCVGITDQFSPQAGARKACSDIGMHLANNRDELYAMYRNEIYKKPESKDEIDQYFTNLGIIWTNNPRSYCFGRYGEDLLYCISGQHSNNPGNKAFCISD